MAEVIAGSGLSLPTRTAEADAPRGRAAAWPLWQRIGFRWLFCYVLLYQLPFPISFLPWGLGEKLTKPYYDLWEWLVEAAGHRLLGLDIAVAGANGSGDTTFSYVQLLLCALLATVAAALWSVLDRRRADYVRLHDWLRAYVRVFLAVSLCSYGAVKVIQSQFPNPSLSRLVQPFGDASPMGLLWTFMGASAPYNFFTGAGEMLGGLLLVARRTALLGALVTIGVMSNVVMLTLCYDVPAKLFSLHLLALAVLVVAPDARRLFDLFVRNRPVTAAELRPLFSGRRSHGVAVGLRTVLLVGLAAWTIADTWRNVRPDAEAKPPLYGVWNVDEMTVDGVVRPPLVTDAKRWRRVVVDSSQVLALQLMSDSRERYRYTLASAGGEHTLKLAKRAADGDPGWKSELRLHRPEPGRIELDGTVDGRRIHAVLRRADRGEPRLLSRGFRWINEYPFNR